MSTSSISVLATLKIGTKLQVETILNEILVGRLLYFYVDYEKLELNEVIDIKTNITYHLPQLLDMNDIIRVYLYEENKCEPPTEIELNQKQSQKSSQPQQQQQQQLPATNLNTTEKLLPFSLITQRDTNYYNAIHDIQAQEIVYMIIEPSFYGRNQNIAIISVATNTMVHIFDMMSLGDLLKEMREILSANYPKKVMHYAHRIKDQLKFKQNLQLSGIMDTFVAYSQMRGAKEPATLTETIEQVLHVPLHSYNFYYKKDTPESVRLFRARPLNQPQLLYLTKLTIYQKQLYKYLVEQEMLKEFKRQCEETAMKNDFDSEVFEYALEEQLNAVVEENEKQKGDCYNVPEKVDLYDHTDNEKEATDNTNLKEPKQQSQRAITLQKLKSLSIAATSKLNEQSSDFVQDSYVPTDNKKAETAVSCLVVQNEELHDARVISVTEAKDDYNNLEEPKQQSQEAITLEKLKGLNITASKPNEQASDFAKDSYVPTDNKKAETAVSCLVTPKEELQDSRIISVTGATDDNNLEEKKQQSQEAITLEKLKGLNIAASKINEQESDVAAPEKVQPKRDYLLEWLNMAVMD